MTAHQPAAGEVSKSGHMSKTLTQPNPRYSAVFNRPGGRHMNSLLAAPHKASTQTNINMA